MQKDLESNVSPFNHPHNTESPFNNDFKIFLFLFLKCSVFLSSQMYLHHMLPFSSYTSRNIPVASLFLLTPHVNFLTVRKSIVSGSANWHSLSLLEFAEEIPIFEKRCGKPLKKKTVTSD